MCRLKLLPFPTTNSQADTWKNRAFDDTSVKFGTHGEDTLGKIFGYRAIAHFARNKNGSRFLNGRHPLLFLETCWFENKILMANPTF